MRIAFLTLLLAVLGAPAFAAEAAIEQGRLLACPYSQDELSAALGTDMKPGKSSEKPYPGGKELVCDYAGRDFSSGNLHVIQTWIPPAKLSAALKENDSAAGRAESIAGDADRAAWIVDPYAGNKVTLRYVRGNVRTEVRLLGGMGKPAELRAKLLALKRVP